MTLVLPYVQKDIASYEQYYDSVLIPECIEKTHPKDAITKRNRWMVETCDLVICYIEHEQGGAYAAVKYAEKLGKNSININATERKFQAKTKKDFSAKKSNFKIWIFGALNQYRNFYSRKLFFIMLCAHLTKLKKSE